MACAQPRCRERDALLEQIAEAFQMGPPGGVPYTQIGDPLTPAQWDVVKQVDRLLRDAQLLRREAESEVVRRMTKPWLERNSDH